MPPWIIITIGIIVLVAILAYVGNKESSKAGKKAAKILTVIETKYNNYTETKINNRILADNSLEIDQGKLSKEVMKLIKPDIDGLISHINATTYSGARTSYDAKHFTNIPPLINEMFEKSTKRKDDTLTAEDENDFLTAFKEGVESDLISRLNKLKIGN